MWNMCCAKDRAKDEQFSTIEMANLPEATGDAPMEPHWASLTAGSRVWDDEPNALEYCRGALCPTLAKEIYRAPFEVMVDASAKNLALVSVKRSSFFRALP